MVRHTPKQFSGLQNKNFAVLLLSYIVCKSSVDNTGSANCDWFIENTEPVHAFYALFIQCRFLIASPIIPLARAPTFPDAAPVGIVFRMPIKLMDHSRHKFPQLIGLSRDINDFPFFYVFHDPILLLYCPMSISGSPMLMHCEICDKHKMFQFLVLYEN